MSTASWISLGIGLWCVVSLGLGLIVGRVLAARDQREGRRGPRLSIGQLARAMARPIRHTGDRPAAGKQPTSSQANDTGDGGPGSAEPSRPRAPRWRATGVALIEPLRAYGPGAPVSAREVVADDALLDRVAAAPLHASPLVEDATDGELVNRLMDWRRDVEGTDTPDIPEPRKPTDQPPAADDGQ